MTTAVPSIALEMYQKDCCYIVRRNNSAETKFAEFRKEILSQMKEYNEKAAFTALKLDEKNVIIIRMHETGDAILQPGEETKFKKINAIAKKIFNDFTIHEKAKLYASKLIEIIQADHPTSATLKAKGVNSNLEAESVLEVIENAFKTPQPKKKTDSIFLSPPEFSPISPLSPATPDTNRRLDILKDISPLNSPNVNPEISKVTLSLAKKEGVKEFPFHFLINCGTIHEDKLTAFNHALTQNGLTVATRCRSMPSGAMILSINIKKEKTEGFDILETYAKIKDSLPKNVHLVFPMTSFLSNIKEVYKDVKQYPELQNIETFVNTLGKDFGENTSIKGKDVPSPKASDLYLSPMKTEETPVKPVVEPKKSTPKKVATPPPKKIEEKPKQTEPVKVDKPKKNPEEKQGFFSKICSWVMAPFRWLWSGFKRFFEAIFG